jgi:hypothetical protein
MVALLSGIPLPERRRVIANCGLVRDRMTRL